MNTSLRNQSKPIIVGLTGGIGSGKSTVAKIFESLGVPVFNSDTAAKNIINNNIDVIEKITAVFGEVYNEGKLDTSKMAEIVFNNKEALEKLNNIVHPEVKKCFGKWVEKNNDYPFLIKEAAILIESGAYSQMDKIILVQAPESERIQRVVERDNVSAEVVKKKMEAQLSDKEKLDYANFIITNDGKELVIPHVLKIYNQLKSLN